MADGRSAPPPADAALVAAVAAGSEDALAELYDRHAGAIHATALRMTGDRGVAEDVVQEVFLTLWNRAERFDPQRGSLAAWLGTIARHRAVDRLRAAGRRPRLVTLSADPDEPGGQALDRAAQDALPGGLPAADDPAAAAEAGEARAAIGAALAAMPEQERDVILLAYRDDLSQSEIAARLGWPLGTVKTRTRRALGRLRGVLADLYGPGLAPMPDPDADGIAVAEPGRREGDR
jgi:RNA polymerase sigma-70 factor (ECF subfamily)